MSEFITTPEEVEEIFGKYFTYDELKCKCGCDKLKLNIKMAYLMLKYRILINEPIIPTSVYRCNNHEYYSLNHDGYAMDIPFKNTKHVYYLVYNLMVIGIKRIGINYDKHFIHWDINPSLPEALFGY